MEPGCKICISLRLFSGPIRHAVHSSRKGRKPGGSDFVSSRISTEEPLVGSALVMLVMPYSAPVGGRRAQFLVDGRTKPVVPIVKVPFDQPLAYCVGEGPWRVALSDRTESSEFDRRSNVSLSPQTLVGTLHLAAVVF